MVRGSERHGTIYGAAECGRFLAETDTLQAIQKSRKHRAVQLGGGDSEPLHLGNSATNSGIWYLQGCAMEFAPADLPDDCPRAQQYAGQSHSMAIGLEGFFDAVEP